jgi:hypothetical protein
MPGAGHPVSAVRDARVTFVFTADPHYGITRKRFRGASDVAAAVVGSALVSQINRVPSLAYPPDEGVGAGAAVGAIDFVAVGGDLTNRADSGAQAAAQSWQEFTGGFEAGLALRNAAGDRVPLYLVPGNHDASSALGWAKAPKGAVDATPMAGIFNRMMHPAAPVSPAAFDYAAMRVHTSREVGGLHLQFVQVWPDSEEREWMERDLRGVPATTPVFIFVHDPPEAEGKHFRAPPRGGDQGGKFEGLLAEAFKDSGAATVPTVIEQRGLAMFIGRHPNIRAWFHGHQNFNEFSTWRGPDHDIALNVFRADSPMKGHFSADDETRLSFQVATADLGAGLMTVRELFWNPDPAHGDSAPVWGASRTIRLHP